jgi:GT2 family glycosyltransferase
MNAKPKVSIVVPYYRGLEHLPALLESIEAQEYPLDRLELILVMNGADDGALDLVNSRFPWVHTVDPGENLGYGGGCNLGAREAKGEWVAFLNTDMRVDSKWLTELLAATERHPDSVCFGSAILSWNGKRIDFAGSAMNFLGVGYQPYHGGPASWLPEEDRQELFVCGGALFMRRDVYLDVGGFDEDFWAYYEDVDLGWRLWVLGYDVWLVPTSIVHHRHHGSFSRVGQERTRLLYERNSLLSLVKNYEQENLDRILPVALMLAAKRAFLATGVDPGKFRIGRTPPHAVAPSGGVWGWRYYVDEAMRTLRNDGLGELWKRVRAELGRRFSFGGNAPYGAPRKTAEACPGGMAVPEVGVAHWLALADVADLYPAILEKRRWIQERRRRSDAEITPLFRMCFSLSFYDSRYHSCLIDLVRAEDLEARLGTEMQLSPER